MPSPFPGMDPFIEMEEWSDFHGAMIFACRSLLAPQLRPRYVVRAEARVYLERACQESRPLQPDVSIAEARRESRSPKARRTAAQTTVLEPELFDIPVPEEQREHFLVIRDRARREVVTVIEFLSPANKRPGGDGYREYYAKRAELLSRHVHLVEIDLLRAGRRLTSVQSLSPATDYCAFIHRHEIRPKAQVLQWTIRDRLPAIQVPLATGEADVRLDLQAAFETAYEGGEYDVTIDYGARLKPLLARSDAAWLKERLKRRRT